MEGHKYTRIKKEGNEEYSKKLQENLKNKIEAAKRKAAGVETHGGEMGEMGDPSNKGDSLWGDEDDDDVQDEAEGDGDM